MASIRAVRQCVHSFCDSHVMLSMLSLRHGGVKVAAMTSSISEYFSRITQNCKPSSTSLSDSSPVTEKIRQDKKIFFHNVSEYQNNQKSNKYHLKEK